MHLKAISRPRAYRFPGSPGPKHGSRLPTHAKQTALVYRHTVHVEDLTGKKKQKTKDLTVYCVAQRQTGAERPHSWMDGRTGVSNAQTAHGEECASVQQPTQAESCGSGSKGQERGGSIGACVGSCCFNPDENSASAMCQ